jgi:hypothetical protein
VEVFARLSDPEKSAISLNFRVETYETQAKKHTENEKVSLKQHRRYQDAITPLSAS